MKQLTRLLARNLHSKPKDARPVSRKRFARSSALLTTVLIGSVLTACSAPTEPGPKPPATDGNLYLVVASDANGLHVIDTTTGAATIVGGGISGSESSGPGLAPSTSTSHLYVSDDTSLHLVERDGTGWSPIGDTTALTEGLAYDPEEDLIYGASNGYLHLLSAATGETIETWLQPPNQPDIEGLTFDPEARLLYGLARGYSSQPQYRHELYVLDVDGQIPSWTTAGTTGGLWAGAGLAFDPENRVLYAVGRQDDPGGLYRIDPDSGATTRVGATGLASAAGGLAWRP